MQKTAYLLLIASQVTFCFGIENKFLGCYKDRPSLDLLTIPGEIPIEQCVKQCNEKFYRYSIVKNEKQCTCSNFLGEEVSNSIKCNIYCTSCDYKETLSDIYSSGNLVSGPPQDVEVTNVTATSISMSWRQPQSFIDILSYRIKATVLHTFSSFHSMDLELIYSNNTFRTTLIVLPATKYNVTISTISSAGFGAVVSRIVETKVGEPDNAPDPPQIVDRGTTTARIKISKTVNNNGPISSYLVIVINDNFKQVFQEELLKSYDDARKEGITYYIAAELNDKDGDDIENFTVGDGRYFGKYYNAPLEHDVNYLYRIGIVSSFNGDTKRAFSATNGAHSVTLLRNNDYPHNDDSGTVSTVNPSGDSPGVIIGLSIAIGLMSFMLVAGIIGFIILKSRVTNRRQRLSDNQELTLQGPMIEVENNGYIHEEDHPTTKANHYRVLKEKLRSIPFNQLKIEPTNLLGIGRFGRVNSGSLSEDHNGTTSNNRGNTFVPVAVYSVPDKRLTGDDKKLMLRDLDVLIRAGKHENVVSLLGTCETPQMVFVVLESVSMNLKDLLLGSRDSLPGRFSNMSESQALHFAIAIAKGMDHLESQRIVHKQLCARNIMIANGVTAKIGGYGLAQYYSHNNLPDYTRWTALEIFRGQVHTPKSDVWSFACLWWEICVLGGTPYGNFSNNEVSDKVTKGLRLPQMQYFSDDLYQIMLNCWQIDMDERPNFNNLVESLEGLKENTLIPYLNFNVYPNFQYEQFYPDMEVAVRPVF